LLNNLPDTRAAAAGQAGPASPPGSSARGLVLAAAVLFGTTGTARALGPDISPLGVGAARIVVGAALLALVAAVVARRASSPAPRWSRMPVVLGGIGVAGYQLAFFAAVADTGVAVGTVVALGSAPVFAGLLSRLTGASTRLGGRWAACTALATAGVAMLVASGQSANIKPLGVALALGAGIGYAAYTVAAKRLLDQGHRPEAVMARTFGAGALILLPILPLTGFTELASPGAVGLALYLAAIPTALAYVLFARGLQTLPTAEVATLTLAEPLTAAALGTIVLGEHLSAGAALGAAMVLAGLAALALKPRRGRKPRLAEATA
jgi:DME family drug/metabolite transporter